MMNLIKTPSAKNYSSVNNLIINCKYFHLVLIKNHNVHVCCHRDLRSTISMCVVHRKSVNKLDLTSEQSFLIVLIKHDQSTKYLNSFVSLHGTARTHTYKAQDDLELYH